MYNIKHWQKWYHANCLIVQSKGDLFSWCQIYCLVLADGEPQGSVLGPLLFTNNPIILKIQSTVQQGRPQNCTP